MSSLSKRSTWTSITPLPLTMTRAAAIGFLQDHEQMIDMNPLVVERHVIPTPAHAEPDEQQCVWYSITDKIAYLPGLKRDLVYTCAFFNLSDGIQTHCHAPLGVEIREKWTIGGSMPGEMPQPVELGIGAPAEGLYIREDVDLTCNFIMAGFVKKSMKASHGSLVEKLKLKTGHEDGKSDAHAVNISGVPPRSIIQQTQRASDHPQDMRGAHELEGQRRHPLDNEVSEGLHPAHRTELE